MFLSGSIVLPATGVAVSLCLVGTALVLADDDDEYPIRLAEFDLLNIF